MDITNQQISVMVGEQISLAGSVLNLPTPNGATISSQSWTVQGNRVGGYTVTGGTGAFGLVTPFADSQTSNITFYWIEGGTNTVFYSATLTDGSIYTAQATFTVNRPTATLAGVVTSLNPPVSIISLAVGLGLYYGDHDNTANAGIVFQFDVTSPTPGDLGLIQLVNTVRSDSLTDGTTKTTSTGGVFALDAASATSPFFEAEGENAPNVIPIVNHVNSAPPGDDNAFSDSPGAGVFSTLQSLSFSDSFQTYLMYRPSTPGSIWVTLNLLNWSWSGSAMMPGGGWVAGPADQYTAPAPTGTSSTALPQWTLRIQDIP
jgi:hypothetical protein